MNWLEELQNYIGNLTIEDKNELREKLTSTIPKGWIDVNEHLPSFLAKDVIQGYSVYKVKDEKGNIFESKVSDSNFWYYQSLNFGITHWLNEE